MLGLHCQFLSLFSSIFKATLHVYSCCITVYSLGSGPVREPHATYRIHFLHCGSTDLETGAKNDPRTFSEN